MIVHLEPVDVRTILEAVNYQLATWDNTRRLIEFSQTHPGEETPEHLLFDRFGTPLPVVQSNGMADETDLLRCKYHIALYEDIRRTMERALEKPKQ